MAGPRGNDGSSMLPKKIGGCCVFNKKGNGGPTFFGKTSYNLQVISHHCFPLNIWGTRLVTYAKHDGAQSFPLYQFMAYETCIRNTVKNILATFEK